MKTTIAIAAVAGLAAAASAQSVFMTSSSALPAQGEVVTISLWLDATTVATPFSSWANWNGVITSTNDGGDLSAASVSVTDGPADTVSTTNFAAADNWASGRRPSAVPGFGGTFGGFRQQVQNYVVTDAGGDLRLDAPVQGGIDALQQPIAAPNTFANTSRVLEVFRFRFTYDAAMGQVIFTASNNALVWYDGSLNGFGSAPSAHPTAPSIGVAVGEPIPAPASLALIGLGGLVATRRRR